MAVKQNNPEGDVASTSSTAQNSNQNEQQNICDLTLILEIIERLNTKRKKGELADISNACTLIVCKLMQIQIPRESQELKQFKLDIGRVGEFLAKISEEDTDFYFGYLRLVYKLITGPGTEIPSAAISIVFQIFPETLITKAVSEMLSTSDHTTDDIIRKTMNVLCNWLRTSNICENLNLWILAILSGLKKQQKFCLIETIALDVVEPLFIALILPVLRPKIAPVVFQLLSSVKHTPIVFHKIINRVPMIIKQIKTDTSEEAKKILQTMVDVLSALMSQFQDYGELYKTTEEVLSEFTPSYNFRSVLEFSNYIDNEDHEVIRTNPKVGLVNLGNTCYMNSVLQALTMTKEFSRQFLLSTNKSPALLKIQQLFVLLLHSVRPELTPSVVLNVTRPPAFVPGFQQDSSEFLGYLLEMIHEHENNSYKIELKKQQTTIKMDCLDSTISPNTSTKLYPTEGSSRETNLNIQLLKPEQELENTTTIDKTFTGKITTAYKCLTCSWQSKNTDTFRDLQLAFPEVKTDCASNYSVQDLLDYYCSSEKLDGDNQYFCEKCKKLCDAEKYINVVNAPNNLILTLKHFKYDQKFHMRAKLMHKVFHDESVSLKIHSEDSLEEISSVHYNLYAAVVHSGFSMDSGHYYTFASENSDQWYKFNDNIVTKSSISELHNLNPPNTPYILFYQINTKSDEKNNSRNHETNEIIQLDIPNFPSLEELPIKLKDFVIRDNHVFMKEMRLRKLNSPENRNLIKNKNNDKGDNNDDEPPPSTCGGNALNCVNRYIY